MNVEYFMHMGEGGGVSNYERELANSLDNITDLNLSVDVLEGEKMPLIGPHIFRPLRIRRKLRSLENPDIIHLPSQDYASALIGGGISQPVVVTVHDLIPLMTSYAPLHKKAASHIYVRGLQYADKIICISEHTRKDVIEAIGPDSEKISVIYPSAELGVNTNSTENKPVCENNIPDNFVLYVGTKSERKNISTVIKSLKYVDGVSLVIVGGESFPLQSKKISVIARFHGVSERVIQTGYVEESYLAKLYRDTLAFVFPTLYEGFGRPPLEAMSVGTPVVASTATAVPEVVGDAAILCEPDEPREWADAIQEIKMNSSVRDRLSAASLDRSKRFDFDNTAKKVKEVYQDIISTG